MGDVVAAFVDGRAAIFPDSTEEAYMEFMKFESWLPGNHKEGIPRMEKCERGGYTHAKAYH